MKNEKSVGLAMIFNFVIWGAGYFYLNKQVIKGFVVFVLYSLIMFFSILILLSGSILTLPIMFWVEFWTMWCSIFLAYDAFKLSKKTTIKPLKIQRVKRVVRRPKVRTRKK